MTGTDIAVPGDDALDAAEAARQLDRLRRAREWVRGCAEAEALGAKQDAEMIKAWVRVHKAATAIAIEACKLEATALRRLCQLKSDAIKGQQRTAGDWLAAMTDAEFEELLAQMKWARSPISLFREDQETARKNAVFERGRDIGRGDGDYSPVDPEAVSKAANELLHSALSRGAVSVNELCDELLRWLDLDCRGEDGYLVRTGIDSIVREALRSESFEDEGHPDFVTWKDEEAGWLRIPWTAATLPQLQWMAEYRQQQVRELRSVADDLSSLAATLTRIASEHPDSRRLSELWKLLRSESGS